MQNNARPLGIRALIPAPPPHTSLTAPSAFAHQWRTSGLWAPCTLPPRIPGGQTVHLHGNLTLLWARADSPSFIQAWDRHPPTVSPQMHEFHIKLSKVTIKPLYLEETTPKWGWGGGGVQDTEIRGLGETPSTPTSWFKNSFPISNNSVQKLS